MNAQKLEFEMPEISINHFSVDGYAGVSSPGDDWGSDEY